MLADFLNYLETESVFNPRKDRILLAISGGVDSMLLANLLKAASIDFGLAHCNFKLRGAESDGDEAFVRAWAEEWKIPLYLTFFDTDSIAAERKTSIQIAARELRYAWLEEIREKQGYDYIATAHHLNDSIESLFLNLTKGCGIRGIHGILPKTVQTKLVRPLLFADKERILAAAKAKNMAYREDSSNVTVKYTRNKIRHQVVPVLKSLNPSLESVFAENFHNFREAEWLYDFAIEKLKTDLLEAAGTKNGLWQLSIEKLQKIRAAKSLLYELLNPYGFSGKQVGQMIHHLNGISGAIYYSGTHRLLRSYGDLILEALPDNQKGEACYDFLDELPAPGAFQVFELGDLMSLQISLLTRRDFEEAPKNPAIAYFDADLLSLPLSIRAWQEGDAFQPFGMGGQHKKVSTLFKNLKLSISEREWTQVLVTGGKIAWVMGLRSDEQFKVSEATKLILQIIMQY